MSDKAQLRSGLVWLLAGLGVTTYATIGIIYTDIPGLVQLIEWLNSFVGWWVLVAVFIAIVIEGLYFVGSFFPGSSIVLVLAIFSQSDSWLMFWFTIITIFVGWLCSSIINIVLAKKYRVVIDKEFVVQDRMLLTWLPAFRANYEVSQIVQGADPLKVLWSSAKVKLFGGSIVTLALIILSQSVNVTEISNDEGTATLYISAVVMISIGIWQIRKVIKNR
jgi:hypothetical protein